MIEILGGVRAADGALHEDGPNGLEERDVIEDGHRLVRGDGQRERLGQRADGV